MVLYLILSMLNEDPTNVPNRAAWKALAINWAPVIFWAGIIFFFSTDQFSSSETSSFLEPLVSAILSGVTPEQFEPIHFVIRKFAHWFEYFVFSLLLIRALSATLRSKLELRRAVSILAVVLLYALSDEFHQVFVPSRTASLADVGIDWFAGICGILWTYLCSKGKSFTPDSVLDHEHPSAFRKKT
jgi:VanZ family protein